MFMAETFRARARARASADAAVPVDRTDPADDAHWLPGQLDAILDARKTVRSFASTPIERSVLDGSVNAARTALARACPAGRPDHQAFQLLVAAFRVQGMAPGLYSLGPLLTEQLLTDDPDWLASAHANYADAPVLVFICADLNAACRRSGPTGYGAELVRAGAFGYAIWLHAISAGVGGHVYGAAWQRVTTAARLVSADLRHVFTVALGLPSQPLRCTARRILMLMSSLSLSGGRSPSGSPLIAGC
jgi:hypothetical protein